MANALPEVEVNHLELVEALKALLWYEMMSGALYIIDREGHLNDAPDCDIRPLLTPKGEQLVEKLFNSGGVDNDQWLAAVATESIQLDADNIVYYLANVVLEDDDIDTTPDGITVDWSLARSAYEKLLATLPHTAVEHMSRLASVWLDL